MISNLFVITTKVLTQGYVKKALSSLWKLLLVFQGFIIALSLLLAFAPHHSPWRNVPSGKEQGEMAVFAVYIALCIVL